MNTSCSQSENELNHLLFPLYQPCSNGSLQMYIIPRCEVLILVHCYMWDKHYWSGFAWCGEGLLWRDNYSQHAIFFFNLSRIFKFHNFLQKPELSSPCLFFYGVLKQKHRHFSPNKLPFFPLPNTSYMRSHYLDEKNEIHIPPSGTCDHKRWHLLIYYSFMRGVYIRVISIREPRHCHMMKIDWPSPTRHELPCLIKFWASSTLLHM